MSASSNDNKSENMHVYAWYQAERNLREETACACVSQIFHAPEALHDGMKY